MALEQNEEESIRKYLLGDFSEDEVQNIEERIMSDNSFAEQVLLVEDSLVEDYVDGRLESRECRKLEVLLLSTPQGSEDLRLTSALREYARRSTPPAVGDIESGGRSTSPGFAQARLWLTAAALLLIGCGIALWRALPRQSNIDKGLAALASAFEKRPISVRITALGYLPRPDTRGDDRTIPNQRRLEQARGLLATEAADRPDVKSLRALGSLYLMERRVDDAIKQLDEAQKLAPDDAQLCNDLGAAYLEKANELQKESSSKGAEELSSALEFIDRALKVDPASPPARFNRALLHESMKLTVKAKEDWQDFLNIDSVSGWADEAREHLKALQDSGSKRPTEQDLIDHFLASHERGDAEASWWALNHSRFGDGNRIVQNLAAAYLDLKTAGKETESQHRIDCLSYAGQLEKDRGGDQFTASLVRVYGNATADALALLSRANKLLERANASYRQARGGEAISLYIRARELFVKAGDDGEAQYVSYRLGHCYLNRSKPKDSLLIFEQLAGSCDRAGYRWLRAQAFYAMAIAQLSLNNHQQALVDTGKFLDLSQQIQDQTGCVKAWEQFAQEYLILNNFKMSLALHQQSLANLDDCAPEPMLKWRTYFYIALPLHELGFNRAAAEYEEEALHLAWETKRKDAICRTYVNLGLMMGANGEQEQALENVAKAVDVAQSISGSDERLQNSAYASLQAGHLYRQASDFQHAMVSYGRASKLYDRPDYRAFEYAALKGKIASCVAIGGCPSIEKDIERAMALSERYRARITEERNRDRFFDLEQDLYDIAVDFQFSTASNWERAFDYFERSRSRSMCDAARNGVERYGIEGARFAATYRPLRLALLKPQLPRGVQIIEYAALKNRLIAWVVSRDKSLQAYSSDLGAAELSKTATEYINLISHESTSGQEQAAKIGSFLYQALIGKVEPALDRDSVLCIVPDRALNYVPFAALIAPSGEYLIQKHALMYSPSANMFVISTNAARLKEGPKSETVLSIGNPAFNRAAFKPFEYLASTGIEAQRVAACYQRRLCLREGEASKAKLASLIGKVEVVNLATHAIDGKDSADSKLLLAGQAGDDAESTALHAYEVSSLNLRRIRLVSLSACGTAGELSEGEHYSRDGIVSLSHSFLAARTPLVIASLWAVNSNSTTDLMVSFHKLRTGRSVKGPRTIEAFRRAQLEMLTGPDERFRAPYYWAPFILSGGYASF